MGVGELTLALALAWAAIHVLNRLPCWAPSRALLPTAYPRGHGRYLSTFRPPAKLVLRYLHLWVEVSSWNAKHDELLAVLARRRNPWSRRLKFLYNCGSVLCVLGIVGSVAMTACVFWQLAVDLSKIWLRGLFSAQSSKTLMSRSLDTTHETRGSPGNTVTPFLKPIIPGITVPLSHLPLALAAVFVAQTIHEAGHAISAALESVPIISVGASIFIFLPSAFVKLSSTALESLAPSGRLRIMAAGSFHNLIFWWLLVVLGKSGIGTAFWSLPYSDISSIGRVVISVEPHSSLYGHLPIGSLITVLDDTNSNSTIDAQFTWPPFAVESQTASMNERGWCIDNTQQFFDTPENCCKDEPVATESPLLVCFTSLGIQSRKQCLDPIQVMATNGRCASADECPAEHSCVRPQNSQQLLRIVFRSPPWSRTGVNVNDEVIIWKGPPNEFKEEVKMGTLFPRFNLLPLWLPLIVQLPLEYLKLASFSLFLFNLLPLSSLDGGKMLGVLLAMIFQPMAIGDADLEQAGRPVVERWKYISRFIHIVTASLLGLVVVLACIHASVDQTGF